MVIATAQDTRTRSRQPALRDGKRLLPNGKVDDAPDCYKVTRDADPGVFHLQHFQNGDRETRPCCSFDLVRTAADLETAHAEGIDVDIVTLRRDGGVRCPYAVKKTR